MITYWTIQTVEKWHKIKDRGYFIGEKEFVWEDFLDPYHWMMKKMYEKLPNYHGEYPVWLWTKKPDLRYSGYNTRGTKCVLLKVEIESERVLLSDFDVWHFVLNNSFINIDSIKDEIEYTSTEIEKSWDSIFDLELLRTHPDWGGSVSCDQLIQGVTGKVPLHEITLVREFNAK